MEGWRAEGGDGYIEVLSDDGLCSMSLYLGYEPAYRADRGDHYLSHETAYATAALSSTKPSPATPMQLGGEVDVVVITYTFENIVGEDTDGVMINDGTVYAASIVRTFDTLVEMPEEYVEDITYVGYETDITKGLPSINGTVQCLDKPLYEGILTELVSSVTVEGVDYDSH
jgi:hypothetical protein